MVSSQNTPGGVANEVLHWLIYLPHDQDKSSLMEHDDLIWFSGQFDPGFPGEDTVYRFSRHLPWINPFSLELHIFWQREVVVARLMRIEIPEHSFIGAPFC